MNRTFKSCDVNNSRLIRDDSKLDEIQFDQTNEHVKTLIQDLRGELLEIEQLITQEDKDRGVAQSG